MKKVRIIEVTSYSCDKNCLAKYMQNKSKLPKEFQVNRCKSKNVLENNTRSSKILQYFFAPNACKEEVEKLKCELKSFKECQTTPTDVYSNRHSEATRNPNNPKKKLCGKFDYILNKN